MNQKLSKWAVQMSDRSARVVSGAVSSMASGAVIGAVATAFALSLSLAAGSAMAKDIELPGDTMLWRQSTMPGYQATLQNCSSCHSAHYAEYQPPNSGRAYWQATVVKMQKAFKAPISDADIPLIVDYLTATYGENRK